MTRPPCKGCEFRRVGFHDPASCSRWATYLTQREQYYAAKPTQQELTMMAKYAFDKRRRCKPQDHRKKGRV